MSLNLVLQIPGTVSRILRDVLDAQYPLRWMRNIRLSWVFATQGRKGEKGGLSGVLPNLVGGHRSTGRYVQESWVVRETELLEPISLTVLASPQTL